MSDELTMRMLFDEALAAHHLRADCPDELLDDLESCVVAVFGDKPLYRRESGVMMYTKGKFVRVW